MSENENIKKISNKFIEEELKNRPMSMFLGVIESEIMDYLGIVGNYFTLDDSKKEKVDVVKSAILSNPNVIQKEIHLQEELEEDPFLDYIWVIHKDTPSEDIMKTVRDWNDSMLNDPDLDWDPFEKERLK
jgi:hypothetical protein